MAVDSAPYKPASRDIGVVMPNMLKSSRCDLGAGIATEGEVRNTHLGSATAHILCPCQAASDSRRTRSRRRIGLGRSAAIAAYAAACLPYGTGFVAPATSPSWKSGSIIGGLSGQWVSSIGGGGQRNTCSRRQSSTNKVRMVRERAVEKA